jgi:hypothetical protein
VVFHGKYTCSWLEIKELQMAIYIEGFSNLENYLQNWVEACIILGPNPTISMI